MKRLTRYVLRQSLGAMLFVTVALTAAIWLAQSLRLIDLIVNRGLSLGLFLYLAVLILPRFLDIVIPIAIFIAVLFTYNKLMAESEVVVMRAAGVSPITLAYPALLLAAGATAMLFAFSAYLLPASNRAFKDLQFEIRNQFVSAVIQEGTFTPISENITVYVRGREPNGELSGLLVQDERDRNKTVTLIAERGAFVDTDAGARVLMRNGTRQQYDRTGGKLSVLSFERYTLDLEELRDAPGVREHEPSERDLLDLWFGPSRRDSSAGKAVVIERHVRLIGPFTPFVFVLIPLACLLSGEFNRRGQSKRVLLAVLFAFLFQAADLGMRNLANRQLAAIPVLYVVIALPIAAGLWMLLRDTLRSGGGGRRAPAGRRRQPLATVR
ncbi:MAG TPA: LPS export ABC transporter permease LptF [Stellaceae bacterium]|jgi:lipopolysaccharide export system permease protein